MPMPRRIYCHRLDDRGYCRYGCKPKSGSDSAVILCHFHAKRPGTCKFGANFWQLHAESRGFDSGRSAPPPTPSPPTPLEQYHMDLAMFGLAPDCEFLQFDMVTAMRRVLSLRWHPDKNNSTQQTTDEATERIQKLNAACERLAPYLTK